MKAQFTLDGGQEQLACEVSRESTTASLEESSDCNDGEEVIESHTSTTFPCIEAGCSRLFQTYRGLESHILLGKHPISLHQRSVYDDVRLQWRDSCHSITEHSISSRQAAFVEGSSETPMGWALKKDRKNARFPNHVKIYLKAVFDAGENSGRKLSAADVAKNMRVCRDDEGQKMFHPEEYLQPSQIALVLLPSHVLGKGTATLIEK